jgi:tetratricopeptide (TPR) repeat protein
MNEVLIHWEQEAINLMNRDNKQKAMLLFKKIISIRPNYEHGICFYHLACCLEDLNKLSEAKENYLEAIKYDSRDPIRLGGYASFLYLHGSSAEAFQAHSELIKLERELGFDITGTLDILKRIGEQIGLTEKDVINQV